MIIVVCFTEFDEYSNRKEVMVSHGYDTCSGEYVVLPCGSPQSIGAVMNYDLGEYVLE